MKSAEQGRDDHAIQVKGRYISGLGSVPAQGETGRDTLWTRKPSRHMGPDREIGGRLLVPECPSPGEASGPSGHGELLPQSEVFQGRPELALKEGANEQEDDS